MKTCVDIAAHLKRNGGYLELRYDEKAGTFLVQDGARIQRSKYLDDALENLAEEKRRQDAQMGPMRDKSVEHEVSVSTQVMSGAAPTLSQVLQSAQNAMAKALSSHLTHSGSSSPATPPLAVSQYPTCAICGKFPKNGASWIYAAANLPYGVIELECDCGNKWRLLGWIGKPIRLSQGMVEMVRQDGKWTTYKATP